MSLGASWQDIYDQNNNNKHSLFVTDVEPQRKKSRLTLGGKAENVTAARVHQPLASSGSITASSGGPSCSVPINNLTASASGSVMSTYEASVAGSSEVLMCQPDLKDLSMAPQTQPLPGTQPKELLGHRLESVASSAPERQTENMTESQTPCEDQPAGILCGKLPSFVTCSIMYSSTTPVHVQQKVYTGSIKALWVYETVCNFLF